MKIFKRIAICAIALFIGQQAYSQVSFGKSVNINSQWKFQLGDNDKAKEEAFNDSKWRNVDLPHDWSVEGTHSPSLASCTGYLPGGIAWYRKTLEVPIDKKTENIFIYFEGIYNNSEVYINGQLVGKRPNGYISFMYDLTPFIKFGENNTIAVKVDHSKYADSRWYTGSGIYRNVFLIYAKPLHIAQWGVFCYNEKVTENEAFLNVKTEIVNSTNVPALVKVKQQLVDKKTKVEVESITTSLKIGANQSSTINQQIKVKSPKLWSLYNPQLYELQTSILNGRHPIDETKTDVGIRTIAFDANNGFTLNGVSMKFKGVCIHHDAGCLGSAVPRKIWEMRLNKLKELGCNAIRMSHNPQAPDVYEICDQIGLLVMNEAFDEWEFPKKKWIEGWNIGKPGKDGSFSYFNEWGEIDLKDMILRDRNHPSIIMWSIGNEVDYPNDPYSHPVLDKEGIKQIHQAGYQPDHPNAERLGVIAKKLVKVVKDNDLSRPATAALAGVVMSNETEYPGALDVAGYNYTEYRYAQDHATYPKRVLYGSENRHDLEAWKSVKDNNYIMGQFLWTGIDYLGEAGRWPSRGFQSGLIDLSGNIKPRGYFRQSLWSSDPMVYIGTYPIKKGDSKLSIDAKPVWNYENEEPVRVVCYTNCRKVGLKLNGKMIDDLKMNDLENGMVVWDIPFTPGKLEVVGYNGEDEAAWNSITTFERPYRIEAKSDITKFDSINNLAIITVQVVDEFGVPVFFADNEIRCTIKGSAKLLGMENSNMSDMTDLNDNFQRVYNGKLVTYIQQIAGNKDVIIEFSSPLLKKAQVEIAANVN